MFNTSISAINANLNPTMLNTNKPNNDINAPLLPTPYNLINNFNNPQKLNPTEQSPFFNHAINNMFFQQHQPLTNVCSFQNKTNPNLANKNNKQVNIIRDPLNPDTKGLINSSNYQNTNLYNKRNPDNYNRNSFNNNYNYKNGNNK
jgi:hypothetical protein